MLHSLPNSLTVDSVKEGVPSVQVGVAVRPKPVLTRNPHCRQLILLAKVPNKPLKGGVAD